MIKKSLTTVVVVLIIGCFLFDCYVGSLTGDKFILQGERALLDKQYTQAIDSLDQAHKEILRSNQSVFFSKGLTMDKMGDLRTINYLQGKANYALEQYDKALEHLNKSIEMDPYHHPSYSKRGETFTRLKQFDKALADYTALIQFNSDIPDGYYRRGVLYSNHMNDYDKALVDFETAVALAKKMPFRPESMYFRNALALTYSETGQFARAEEILSSILTKADLLNSAFRSDLQRQLEAIKNKQPWSEVQPD